MSLGYQLMIEAPVTIDAVAQRAFPGVVLQRREDGSALEGDLFLDEALGVTIHVAATSYLDIHDGEKSWEREIASTNVYFTLDRGRVAEGSMSALRAVRRFLESGPEDVVYIQNFDYLLLSRRDGQIARFNEAMWWSAYPDAGAILTGGKN